ncbi:MAG: SpoIID/LytB domain-containing protein [Bacteroidales bacterium]
MKSSPEIHVGIVSRSELSIRLSGKFSVAGTTINLYGRCKVSVKMGKLNLVTSTETFEFDSNVIFSPCNFSADLFELNDVVIGIDFHWQKEELQKFRGALKLIIREGKVMAINIIPAENYLYSVISSEMSANSSLSLLKAHAIISRSWLMAQLDKKVKYSDIREIAGQAKESPGELIQWFDRDDHHDFHVCADDHCQRYQGVTKLSNEQVVQAVKETKGEVLVYEDDICDTRYSKSCGGATELYENCWEPVNHPYLRNIRDISGSPNNSLTDFTVEKHAEDFILGNPEAFCNTSDKEILSQVLNDYDQETENFFRWTVNYKQEEIAAIIRKRSGIDFGKIISLEPVQRGKSGRLIKLKITGTKETMVIGKELIIRKWLSSSHLYSAAFIVETEEGKKGKVPRSFTLRGAGWGHGVGLCQIGAAVMGVKGYTHTEILAHYFPGAEIKKMYS